MKINDLNVKRLFLIDGLGAVLSAFLLGVVLVNFEHYFGMPRAVLYILSLGACLFAVYSICCSLVVVERWRLCLKIIAIANLLYCCITLGLVAFFFKNMTPLGLTYFTLEVALVGALASVELLTALKKTAP